MYLHNKYGDKDEIFHSNYYSFSGSTGRKLLLLHGSRLAGLDTWGRVVPNLTEWSEILIPDLPGVGSNNPQNVTDHDFTLSMIIDSIKSLIDKYGWSEFDLVGYSIGGFIGSAFLKAYPDMILNQLIIESALFVVPEKKLSEVGVTMNEIADLMLTDPDKGNNTFSDLVSSNQRKFPLSTSVRPIHNALGFANLLRILGGFCLSDKVLPLIDCQRNTTLVVTEYSTREANEMAFHIKQRISCEVISIPNFDHSFVFVDPIMTANLINNWCKKNI
ncbi:alpha/beta hydrolase [Marinomonas sp. TI.3.20]|uniref:alpha/beta fold hydrolase n=1 Tax=Marinomonas sp. TI.3.20 TaxID=3121296 RepID=UPI00311D55D4